MSHLCHALRPAGRRPLVVSSLTFIAALGCASPAAAASIKDDELVIGVKAQLQLRGNFLNDATTANESAATGSAYDPNRGTTGDSEDARFIVRRAMFGLVGSYGDYWNANLTMRGGENTARNSTGSTDPFNLWFAWAQFSAPTGPVKHALKFGLDKPFNTESTISSNEYLFPTDRLIAGVAPTLGTAYRGVGVAYKLSGPFFAIGTDLLNNSTATKDAQAGDNTGADNRNRYYTSARLELAPGADYLIKKRTESFLGKAGTEAMLGFDVALDKGSESDDATATTYTVTDTFIYGPDLMVHWEKVSFLAEIRWTRVDPQAVTNTTGADVSTRGTKGRYWNLQAAYAIPFTLALIEPCLRYSVSDNDLGDTEQKTVFGNGENGNAGRQWDVGNNFYWLYKGHNLKTQVAFTHWKAETGDGDANILRVQQQFAF